MNHKDIQMLIGDTNEHAKNIKNYFIQKGICAQNVERNPLTIQYSAMKNKPNAVLISGKTRYLAQLCQNFQNSENAPYIFIMSNKKDEQECPEVKNLADVMITDTTDSEKIYNDLMNCIKSNRKKSAYRKTELSSDHNKSENFAVQIHNLITDILEQLNVKPNYNGYNYIRESVKLAVLDENLQTAISKEIYPQVAKKMNTTASGVERSIRTAIHRSWEGARISDKMEVFGSYAVAENWMPTNSEYISIIAERLRRKLNSM